MPLALPEDLANRWTADDLELQLPELIQPQRQQPAEGAGAAQGLLGRLDGGALLQLQRRIGDLFQRMNMTPRCIVEEIKFRFPMAL